LLCFASLKRINLELVGHKPLLTQLGGVEKNKWSILKERYRPISYIFMFSIYFAQVQTTRTVKVLEKS